MQRMKQSWHKLRGGGGDKKHRKRNDGAESTSVEGEGLQTALGAGVNGFPVIPAAHTDIHTAAVRAGANPTTQQPQGTTGAATLSFSLPLEIHLTPTYRKHTATPNLSNIPTPKPTAHTEGNQMDTSVYI